MKRKVKNTAPTCKCCRRPLPKDLIARDGALARTLSAQDLDAIQDLLGTYRHRVSARGIVALGLLYEDAIEISR